MPRVPSYLKHSSGQARVIIRRKVYYLGVYGTPESKREYDRLIAEYLTTKYAPAPMEAEDGEPLPSIEEVWQAFWQHGVEYYGDQPKSTLHTYRHAMSHVRELYGDQPADVFQSLELVIVQRRMIDSGRSRTTINMHTSRIKRVFRWAVSRKLVPEVVYQSLSTVEGNRCVE